MDKLPIKAAEDVAKKYDQAQVILVTWDEKTGLTHTVSYGKNKKHCAQAAEGISLVREVLGFPPEMREAKVQSPRVGLNNGPVRP